MDNRHVAIETVTPARAIAYLANGARNRNEKTAKQASYQRDMESGRWTWDTLIKFDEEGRLVDGFNRLRAQVAAGVTIEYIVARGAYQRNTDTNTVRKFSDELKIQGYGDPSLLSSAVSWHIFFKYPDRRTPTKGANGRKTHFAYSLSELEGELLEMKGWEQFVSQARRLSKVLHVSDGLLLVILTRTHEYLADDAAPFFASLESGEGDLLNVRLLRERLVQDAVKPHRASTAERLVWITKAWNGYMAGTELSQLKWTVGGHAPETFPEMILRREQ